MGEVEDLIREIVDASNKDVERFQRDGMTKDEAEKMVVWGNKEGKPKSEVVDGQIF